MTRCMRHPRSTGTSSTRKPERRAWTGAPTSGRRRAARKERTPPSIDTPPYRGRRVGGIGSWLERMPLEPAQHVIGDLWPPAVEGERVASVVELLVVRNRGRLPRVLDRGSGGR